MALQFLFLVILTSANVMAEESTQVDKRLLLDDPQTVSNQMLSLQREIQTLQTKIAEIDVHQSQIQFLNAQVSQLQQENNALKLQISQGSSNQEVQTLTSKVASLDHELPLLKSKMSDHQLQVQSLNATVFKISQKNSDIEAKVNEVVEKNKNLVRHSGTTSYPIWGRKSCPAINGTETVYTGITAGKHATNTGSGTNTLCLPHDPDSLPSDFPTTTHSSYYAAIFGAEYQFTYKNVAVDDDVPCAICTVKSATTTMMIPAKLDCPQNWTLQYHGYLGASYYSDKGTEYICVDNEPEYFEGLRQVNSDGLLIYPVKAYCGALPCPKYKQNQYLSCAICTM